ncbi:hypothetical protein [Helicobacter pylori]|uniref:hypothetical protein n=1 Tax=Helicobacter pylori TaxID=210 RepID=UPI000A62DA6A|nr:hypothetical protein [Helicobacter pylori]
MKFIVVRVSHQVSLWLNYKEIGLGTPKLTEPNPTTNALKSKSLIQWFLSQQHEKLCPF